MALQDLSTGLMQACKGLVKHVEACPNPPPNPTVAKTSMTRGIKDTLTLRHVVGKDLTRTDQTRPDQTRLPLRPPVDTRNKTPWGK